LLIGTAGAGVYSWMKVAEDQREADRKVDKIRVEANQQDTEFRDRKAHFEAEYT
jgi:hypothetical protein